MMSVIINTKSFEVFKDSLIRVLLYAIIFYSCFTLLSPSAEKIYILEKKIDDIDSNVVMNREFILMNKAFLEMNRDFILKNSEKIYKISKDTTVSRPLVIINKTFVESPEKRKKRNEKH